MIEFKLFRFPILIHWTFFVLCAFIGGIFYAKSGDDVLRVLFFMVAAFHSILIHELGHAFAGRIAGAPMAMIQLHTMGGVTIFPGNNFSRLKNILVTVAGPLASVGLAMVFVLINYYTAPLLDTYNRFDYFITYLIRITIFINLFWTFFNLFPVLPLDGGHIVQGILGPKRIKTTCIISFAGLAVMAALLWFFTQSFFNLIFVAVIGRHTWLIWEQVKNQ